MGAMDRHRLKRQLRDLDLSVLGDAADTALYTGAIAEGLKLGGGIAAEKQKKDEEAKRTAEEKKAYDAAHKDEIAATAAAKEARKQATLAAAEALGETNPDGPKHKKAEAAESNARVQEAKAAFYSTGAGVMPGAAGGYSAPSAGVPTWVWYAGGAVGAGVLGLVVWKLAAGRK
jgi:hypothetical protein